MGCAVVLHMRQLASGALAATTHDASLHPREAKVQEGGTWTKTRRWRRDTVSLTTKAQSRTPILSVRILPRCFQLHPLLQSLPANVPPLLRHPLPALPVLACIKCDRPECARDAHTVDSVLCTSPFARPSIVLPFPGVRLVRTAIRCCCA